MQINKHSFCGSGCHSVSEEAENHITSFCVFPELEAARHQLLVSEREKTELATLYEQRLDELEHLKG